MKLKAVIPTRKPYKTKDKFIMGYVCAVCTLIRMDGLANIQTREIFRAGVGNKSIAELKRLGVDEYDLEILEEHYTLLFDY